MKEKINNSPNLKKRLIIKLIGFFVIIILIFLAGKRLGLCLSPLFSISDFGNRFVIEAENHNIDLSEFNIDNTLVICGQFRWSDGDYRAMCFVVPNYTSDLISFSGTNSNFTLSNVPKFYYYYETYNNSGYMYAKSFETRSNSIQPYSELQDLFVISNYLPNDNNIVVDIRGLEYVQFFGISEQIVVPDFNNPELINGIGHHVGNTYSQILNGELTNDESLTTQNGHYNATQNSISNNLPTTNDTDLSLLGKITNLISGVVSNTSNFFGNFWGNLFNQLSFSADYILFKIGGFFNGIYDYFDSFLSYIIDKFDSVIDAINSLNNQNNKTWDDVVSAYSESSIYGVTHSIFQLYELTDDYFDVDATVSPIFTISLADTPLEFAENFTLDFSWYESIRDDYILIFMGIVSAVFVWHCVRSIPSLISGLQGYKEV